jgi:zinc protease
MTVLLFCVMHVNVHAQSITPKDFTLKNGMKVVMAEDHTVPSICFSMAVRAGSRYERPCLTGISHLFEHMMFNGSKNYKPTEFDKILEAGGGYSNAETGRDFTFYYEEFSPELLDRVLDMEADRIHFLKIDSANIGQERGIVKEERRWAVDDNVQSKMFEDLYATAYVAHAYRNPIIGWMKDLDNITLQEAKDYFRMYYAPNNIAVIVVGAFDSKTFRPKMERLFGSVPRQSAPPRVNDPEPPQLGERREKLHKAAELPAVAIAYKTVGVSSPDYCPVDLLSTILSHGPSSRMYRRLVYELQLAADVACSIDSRIDPGVFTLYVQLQPDRSVEDAESEVYKMLAEIAGNGVSDEELHKAKNVAEMNTADELKTNAGIAARLARYEVVHGNYQKSFEMLPRYESVTVGDIQRVARKYFSERTRSVVVLVPEKAEASDGKPLN